MIINVAPVEPSIIGAIAIGILLTPFMSEIYRSGIQSVRRGYAEAGEALGMSQMTVRRRIIMPIALRLMLPAIGAQVVATLLNSSFVAIIGGKDLTGMSRNIIYSYFTSELWLVVAFTYLAVSIRCRAPSPGWSVGWLFSSSADAHPVELGSLLDRRRYPAWLH